MEWFATTDADARLVPPLDVAFPFALVQMVEEVDGHRFAVATRGARLMRQQMISRAACAGDDTMLGQGQQFNVGEDRGIEIGWRRSADFMGPDYMRRPSGYIRTVTLARRVEKATRPLTPDQMRRLARQLGAWADKLERHQAAWDAAERTQPVAAAQIGA